MNLEIQKPYSLLYLLKYAYKDPIKNIWDSILDNMVLFIAENTKNINEDTIVYLDYINPEINSDNIEGYSKFVLESNLEILCLGDIFLDVIDFYKEQRDYFESTELIKSLEYYLNNDDFLDFD